MFYTRAHFRFDNAVVALASLPRVSLPQLISSATTGEACHEEQRGAGGKTREGREHLEEESLKEHQVATLFGEVRDDGGGYCFNATICGIIARNNPEIKVEFSWESFACFPRP